MIRSVRTPRSSTPSSVLRSVLGWAVVVAGFGVSPLDARGQAADEILVLAASSLTDVLPAIADAWRRAGGARVRFSFDATSRLAPQAVRGAGADVFFSADGQWMDWLVEREAVRPDDVRDFLGNRLARDPHRRWALRGTDPGGQRRSLRRRQLSPHR